MRWVISLALLIIIHCADARDEFATRVNAGEVELDVRVEPERAVVPGERIRIDITVGTRRWFTGGTRIRLPAVPDMILKQNQQFAVNASERRSDGGWTLQRWTIDGSVTRPGVYTIPPISLAVQIAGDAGRSLSGTLKTEALTITSALPGELQPLTQWVASADATLTQELDLAEPLSPGDAVRRTLSLRAIDVLSLQLPALSTPAIEGLQHYPEPPVLRDRHNRGAMQAERRETTVWIATKPGEYTLPAVNVFWWDTGTSSLRTLSAPAVTLTVSGEPDHSLSSQIPRSVVWAILGIFSAAVCIGLAGYYRLHRRLGRYLKGAHSSLTAAWQRFRRPVLPERLNPGGSDSAPAASSPPRR